MENMKPKRDMKGRRIYPPLDAAMKAVVLEEVETYILCRQNTVDQYITTRPILELCLETGRHTGAQVSIVWLYQSRLDLGKVETVTDMET